MATIEKLIAIAKAEVGYDRYSDPEKGTKYGRWYEAEVDKCKTNYDYGANGVAYCAMFASWVLAQAGVKAPGMPSAYCPAIHTKQNVGKYDLKRGDLILFDWDNDKTDDHIGIVTGKTATGYTTIEGNTNGGKVLERTRAFSTVCGGIRPYYDAEESKPQASAKPATPSAKAGIEVDGIWGCETTRALQKHLGTPVDGIVSGQAKVDFDAINDGGLLRSSWEIGKGGSMMVKALQRKLGGLDVDGYAGRKTISALQRKLGTPVDGCISKPSDCVKALQRRLNDGTF